MKLIVRTAPEPAEKVLEGDRELLRAGEEAVLVGSFSELAITLGASQHGSFPGLSEAISRGVPVLSRPSGGGSLLHHPGDLHFARVIPRSSPRFPTSFTRAYAALGAGVVSWLGLRGLRARWDPAPGTYPSYCLTSSRGQVLTVGGRILGGASQHVTHRALLHHGAIASSVDPALLEVLFGLPRELAERDLTSLGHEGIRSLGPEDLAALGRELAGEVRP
jgi:lipoate-protein ligase A